jgi:hypothetical protein
VPELKNPCIRVRGALNNNAAAAVGTKFSAGVIGRGSRGDRLQRRWWEWEGERPAHTCTFAYGQKSGARSLSSLESSVSPRPAPRRFHPSALPTRSKCAAATK